MADYLLEEVRKLVDKNESVCNPSLYLDKFTGYLSQEEAKDVLNKITKLTKNNYIPQKRLDLLKNLPNFTNKKFKTQGPFTIHLSRDIALENTGICFHPIYGFVYIPGSGIKGLARAYAEQVWKPAQSNKDDAEKTIIEIFGNENAEKDPTKMKAGKVVFHDAFPENIPQLYVAISNCHHPGYYSEDKKIIEQLKPGETGDFENPNPVYFLAVKEGAVFNFGLSIRQGLDINENNAKNLINQAFEFLAGGIAHMGLGAKTSSGFGTFIEVPENNNKPIDVPLPDKQNKFVTFEGTLKFTTPAFLAGALDKSFNRINNEREIVLEYHQNNEDANITGQTLRGQLRWWWRVIHSNFLESSDLLKLEKLVWGLTDTSSPIRIVIKEVKFQKEIWDNWDVSYLSYGIGTKQKIKDSKDKEVLEKIREIRKNPNFNGGDDKYLIKRNYIKPESFFKIKVYFNDNFYEEKINNGQKIKIEISKEEVEKQFKFALYLLTTYGGLGAKSRKGFGSVVLTEKIKIKIKDNNGKEVEVNEKIIKDESKRLRQNLGFKDINGVNDWNLIKPLQEKITINNVGNSIEALKKLNKVYYNFAKAQGGEYKNTDFYHKHRNIKVCLGLPRKDNKYFLKNHPSYDKEKTKSATQLRQASPIIFHLDKEENKYKLNICIIPTNYLIDRNTCQKFLEEFAEYVRNKINR